MTNSALVSVNTNIVYNIIVSDPVDPSPYDGFFMIGLVDPTFQIETVTRVAEIPSDATLVYNDDGSITVTLSDGQSAEFPNSSVVVQNPDGTYTISYTSQDKVEVNPGTPCEIGWIYDPNTGQFNAPANAP